MTDETSITVRFNKPLDKFTTEDRNVILRRLRAYMRGFNPEKPRKRRRTDPGEKTGNEIVAEAFDAFDRWRAERDPDGEMELLDAAAAYAKETAT
jgi:hypothetical protein